MPSVFYEAREYGERCGQCGRSLAPDEPVYLWRMMASPGTFWLGPGCGACADKRGAFRWRGPAVGPFPCAGCGRAIYRRADRRWRRQFHVCSERCRWRVATRRRADMRMPEQQHACTGCGAPFTARRGAAYCSSACRQKAYRERHRGTAGTVEHSPISAPV